MDTGQGMGVPLLEPQRCAPCLPNQPAPGVYVRTRDTYLAKRRRRPLAASPWALGISICMIVTVFVALVVGGALMAATLDDYSEFVSGDVYLVGSTEVTSTLERASARETYFTILFVADIVVICLSPYALLRYIVIQLYTYEYRRIWKQRAESSTIKKIVSSLWPARKVNWGRVQYEDGQIDPDPEAGVGTSNFWIPKTILRFLYPILAIAVFLFVTVTMTGLLTYAAGWMRCDGTRAYIRDVYCLPVPKTQFWRFIVSGFVYWGALFVLFLASTSPLPESSLPPEDSEQRYSP